MASSLALILLTLTPTLLLLTPQASAQSSAPAVPLNLTGILEKSGQYTTLIRLLTETQQLQQLQSQLNSTSEGFTVFAPTDNAFQNLKSGAINSLTDQEKVQLILYHVTPKYYSISDLLTVSNPVRTQASGSDGSWGLNFAGQGNQVNVSTGVVETAVNNALRQRFPLAVYQVDKVLLPEELFGAKSPAPAPKAVKSPGSKGVRSDASLPKSQAPAKSPASKGVTRDASSPKSQAPAKSPASKGVTRDASSPKSPAPAKSPASKGVTRDASSPKSPAPAKSPASKGVSSDASSPSGSSSSSSSDNNGGNDGRNLAMGLVVGLALFCMGALF